MIPRPGEVWLADLGMAAKTRPVVVVSRYDEDPPRVLVLYVPLTSENRGSEYEVEMPKLPFLHRVRHSGWLSPAANAHLQEVAAVLDAPPPPLRAATLLPLSSDAPTAPLPVTMIHTPPSQRDVALLCHIRYGLSPTRRRRLFPKAARRSDSSGLAAVLSLSKGFKPVL